MTDEVKALSEQLLLKKKGAYEVMTAEDKEAMEAYAKGYMTFLDASKTEREAVKQGVALAEAAGFKPYTLGEKVEVGGKYYLNNRGKALYIFRIGSESLEKGVRVSAAHIDSPRLDLKPRPLYEDSGMGYFKTHYYGGIRKYQWVTIPLALHGVVVKKGGESVEIAVGDDAGDPVFYITDLLPHLAKDQNGRTLGTAIPGEKLNVLVGASPLEGADSDSVKLQVMKLLNEKYGITESDFLSAELSFVPAFNSREIGFDRALIGGYGHDDRVCAYPAITAMIGAAEQDTPHTVMAILADKEEVGSGGNTGMQSGIFLDLIEELSKSLGANFNVVKAHSKCLSADVNAAFDPDFGEVYERRNACTVNGGVVLTKYTGSGGKSGTNDASAEFVGEVRDIFDAEKVVWQTGELGKVDQGGGGTVAIYISTKNIDVVDLGVPVLSMHAPWECISKADLYMTHRAFLAFNVK